MYSLPVQPNPRLSRASPVDKSQMKERERVQVEELFFVHLNMLNAGTKGVNAAISSRKHISATTNGGEVRGVKMDVRLCSSKHAKYQSALSTRL